jgi:hypothetical protein
MGYVAMLRPLKFVPPIATTLSSWTKTPGRVDGILRTSADIVDDDVPGDARGTPPQR